MRHYFEKLSRALSYFRQGWNSPDYDHYFLLDDLAFKLERIARSHLKEKFYEGYYTNVKDIIKLLQDIRGLQDYEDFIGDPLWDRHDKKWGVARMKVEDGKVNFYRNKLDRDWETIL